MRVARSVHTPPSRILPSLPPRAMDRFEEEALPHLSEIRALALRLTGDGDEAADLVQDTYYRAMRYWDGYQKGTNCRAWLARICRNQFLRSRELQRRRHEEAMKAHGTWTREALHPGPVADPAELTWSRIVRARVRDALEELPGTYQEPLRLRVFGEMRYREISDLLGVPEGTVKSRLHRGRRRLAAELEDQMPDRVARTS